MSSSMNNQKPFHVVLCTGKDIKGLIAANMAEQFLSRHNMRLTIFLGHDAPKTEGARLAKEKFGPYEYDHWFGNDNLDDENSGFLNLLDECDDHTFEKRNVGHIQAFRTFQELRDCGIQVTVLEKKINHSFYLDMIRDLEPDVIYSARFQQIFKAPILEIPTHGVLNMHPGALPDYKGLHVDMRAMMDRIECCTMTMHEVDTGIDTGKFLDDFDVKINHDTSLFWHRLELQVGGMNMFFNSVLKMSGMIESDSIPKYRDQSKDGQYFTWPDQSEYDLFDEMGLKHFEKSDLEFVEALFDKRVCYPITIKQQSHDGMFVIGK